MKNSSREQLEGALRQATGTVKEKVGIAMDDPKLTAEGKIDRLMGKAQQKVAKVQKGLEK